MIRNAVHIEWSASTSCTGETLALIVFDDRTYEYVPHTEFA